jgi:hypothetical protein
VPHQPSSSERRQAESCTCFWQLNKYLKQQPFPLPKILDQLQKLQGFMSATAIDLSMGYYHDPYLQHLCTAILLWGKYQYEQLPMGIMNSPDIFQSIVMDILSDLDYACTYIDQQAVLTNILQNSMSYSHVLKTRASRQTSACSFAKEKLEYLGYWLMRAGLNLRKLKQEYSVYPHQRLNVN